MATAASTAVATRNLAQVTWRGVGIHSDCTVRLIRRNAAFTGSGATGNTRARAPDWLQSLYASGPGPPPPVPRPGARCRGLAALRESRASSRGPLHIAEPL